MLTVSTRLPSENNMEFSYRVIKEEIMSLQLEPGQAIRAMELAEMLHLSRTPIREVLVKLREENLVEVIPQIGTYVSKIKPQLIQEASFMRFTLEKEVLKCSCESFSQESLLKLKKNFALQKELIVCKGSEIKFHKLDNKFHFIIFQENQKQNVWGAITRLSTHYNRIRLLSEKENGFNEAIAQHKAFIKIIENKEIDKVEELLRQHISEPIKLWESLLREHSPYFN